MARSGDDGFDQRLDRWVEAGRQLVDGVSGARPGSRQGGRGSQRRSGARLNPGELGRWVENKLEWLLDDEGADDWREPWQQPLSQQPQARGSRRQPLQAISRRGPRPSNAPPAASGGDDWPDDASFSVPRWQRQAPLQQARDQQDPGAAMVQPDDQQPRGRNAADRPLPRSSRRR